MALVQTLVYVLLAITAHSSLGHCNHTEEWQQDKTVLIGKENQKSQPNTSSAKFDLTIVKTTLQNVTLQIDRFPQGPYDIVIIDDSNDTNKTLLHLDIDSSFPLPYNLTFLLGENSSICAVPESTPNDTVCVSAQQNNHVQSGLKESTTWLQVINPETMVIFLFAIASIATFIIMSWKRSKSQQSPNSDA